MPLALDAGQPSSAGHGGVGQPAGATFGAAFSAPFRPAKFEKVTVAEDSPPTTVSFHTITKMDPFKTYSIEQYHWLDYEAKSRAPFP